MARYHGGNNAGHTVVVEGEQTILHVTPAGILNPDTVNLIGPGVVVDPVVLLGELDKLKQRGILRDPARVRLSGRAHLILPWHTALDKAREKAARGRAIGTTGRGIGPTYEDKVARRGIRVADLLQPEALRAAIDRVGKLKNFELVELYSWDPIDPDALYDRALEWGRQLEPYIDHTQRVLEQALREWLLRRRANHTALDQGSAAILLRHHAVAGDSAAGIYPQNDHRPTRFVSPRPHRLSQARV